MERRDIREDQHGIRSTYTNGGCRCDGCRGAQAAYQRARREKDPERSREYMREYMREYRRNPEQQERQRQYRLRNREYFTALTRTWRQRQKAEFPPHAEAYGRWQPHEDALLARITSNIAVASATGRTHRAVERRRRRLRAKGLLP